MLAGRQFSERLQIRQAEPVSEKFWRGVRFYSLSREWWAVAVTFLGHLARKNSRSYIAVRGVMRAAKRVDFFSGAACEAFKNETVRL